MWLLTPTGTEEPRGKKEVKEQELKEQCETVVR